MQSSGPETKPLHSFLESWATAARSFQETIARATETFRITVLPTLEAFAESVRRLPDELRPMVRTLAERGWFISGEMGMSELRVFQLLSESGTIEDIDALMSEWIESELPQILQRSVKRFPSRKLIIEAAITAHSAGNFELSVPVLLIQVEGMCIEVLGRKLFSTKSGIPRTKEATEALIDSAFSEVVFLPLRETHGLTASEDTRDRWPDAPNRHEILHGLSTDYGTKLNSQKALSLVEYFVTFVASNSRVTTGAETTAYGEAS